MNRHDVTSALRRWMRVFRRNALLASNDPRRVVYGDHDKNSGCFDAGNGEDVFIGLLVGRATDGEQRDDRAVMRQGIHAPDAIEATRCNTSSGMPAALAAAMNSPDIAASAIDMPPEAEPVIPASVVTVIASLTSGLEIALKASGIQGSREALRSPRRNRTRKPC